MEEPKKVHDLPRGGRIDEYRHDRTAMEAFQALLDEDDVGEIAVVARRGRQIVAMPLFLASEIEAPMEEQRNRMIMLLIEAAQLLVETLPLGHPLAEPRP